MVLQPMVSVWAKIIPAICIPTIIPIILVLLFASSLGNNIPLSNLAEPIKNAVSGGGDSVINAVIMGEEPEYRYVVDG